MSESEVNEPCVNDLEAFGYAEGDPPRHTKYRPSGPQKVYLPTEPVLNNGPAVDEDQGWAAHVRRMIEQEAAFDAARKGQAATPTRTGTELAEIAAALSGASDQCRFHGDEFGRSLGWERGQPRCDSCKQPYRIRQAREALARLRGDAS